MVWLIYSDEELLAAKRNRLAVNRTLSGRCFAGCLPFFRVGQGGVLEKQEASAEEADSILECCDLFSGVKLSIRSFILFQDPQVN